MNIRIILAIVGVLIVLGIIVDGVRKRRQSRLRRKLSTASTVSQADKKVQSSNSQQMPTLETTTTEINQLHPRPELVKQDTKTNVVKQQQPEAVAEEPLDDYIILTILAPKDKKFEGFELLQALLKAGFKYGEMKLFHRHRDLDNKSPVYFSVASLTKPGYFDIQNMNICQTRGLNLFMSVPSVDDAQNVFEIMLSTAQQLADKLHGKVCDRHRQPLTEQAIEACRARAKISGNIQQQMQSLHCSDE